MGVLSFTTTLLSLSLCVDAWLPGTDKQIFARSGTNLFQRTPSSPSRRWTPASGKIRGVNLGSLFVLEPWMASSAWSSIGCSSQKSEFDCVSYLGQSAANAAFQSHWESWITQDDITEMQSYGLNTVRIPVGYWMYEDLVYSDSEHFPQGGLAYLEKVVGWASDAGFYIILDLHGAPGAQVASNPDTGQYASTPGFYVDYQYDRATSFLQYMTNIVHTNSNYRNVGMLEIVNEPVQNESDTPGLRNTYYVDAYNAIRSTESSLGVSANNYLHIQAMNEEWGSGDPNEYLSNTYFFAHDDHRYLKYDTSVAVSQSAYLQDSCTSNRNPNNWTPTIVGEFSLSVPDNVQWTDPWLPSTQQTFYADWFAAQVQEFEAHTSGWVFWSWKTDLGDYRWSYQEAVQAGVIPTDLDALSYAC